MNSDDNRPKAYLWEDGVLFTIIDNMGQDAVSYSLPVVKFNAWKWRTPLGAYYFHNCSAVWPQMGTWGTYNIEYEMISQDITTKQQNILLPSFHGQILDGTAQLHFVHHAMYNL